ncbi:GNAT family N-acetyltransferase [Halomonas sp. ML-15]|uniref:GNAT family N-acetyltransferase n=1 Tax=Halomonas sp. ML-15 TaxID=2773305 RepID=UPI0017470E19|nr:GNAT family N-acetyltransferase [Halomonas sp. ML-15]MBD3895834.1 GNAT family N-acetyltransferase [Halomonas sp. ML-15]
MIRDFRPGDMDAVIDIWLDASIAAHDFIDAGFWRSKADDMREVYIPASETYVYDHGQVVKGFFSLHGDALAALFVAPACQGQGIGSALLERAKRLRSELTIDVYKENRKTIGFYESCGFEAITETVCEYTGHRELVMRRRRAPSKDAR